MSKKDEMVSMDVSASTVEPGLVESYVIGLDTPIAGGMSFRKGSRRIAKSTSQVFNDDIGNYNYMPPKVNPKVIQQFYESNIFHARAINLKALCVGGIGYSIEPVVKDTEKNVDHSKDPEYIKLKSFCDTPNQNDREDVDEEDILENILVNWLNDRYSYGYSYLEIVENLKGELSEIYNLRAHNVFARLYYNTLYYIQRSITKEVWFKRWNSKKKSDYNGVLMLKNYNATNKYYGYPEWFPATPDIVTDRSIIDYRLRKFDNNLMMQFIIIVEGGALDEKTLENIQSFLRNNYKGVSNSGKVLVLKSLTPGVNIRIEKIEPDVAELSFRDARDQLKDFVLAAHGVPTILLGVKFKGQLGGTTEIKDLFKIFNETIVKPEKRTVENKLNKLFREKLHVTKYKLVLKELTVDTLKEMVDYVSRMIQANIIDENEARDEFGYDARDIEPGDVNAEIKDLTKRLNALSKRLLSE